MRRIFRTLILVLVALCSVAWGQSDVFITGTNYYTILARGAAWGAGVNNNFIFSAVNPNTQVCLYVTNNNPSSSHSFTLALWQAGDPAVKTFQNVPSKWGASATTQTFPVTVNPSTTVGLYFNVTAAAQLTAQFTGSSAQAGSPDTADIFAVQTTAGACGLTSGTPVPVLGAIKQGGNVTAAFQFPIPIGAYSTPGQASTVQGYQMGSAGNGFLLDAAGCCASTLGNNFFTASGNFAIPKATSGIGTQLQALMNVCPVTSFGTVSTVRVLCGYTKTSILEMATDISSITGGSMPAWSITGRATNPGANTLIVGDTLSTSAVPSTQYKSMTFGCSAVCELQVIKITSLGTTCGAVTPAPLNLWGSTAPTYGTGHVAIQQGCAAQPTTSGAPLWDVFVPAGETVTLDVTGLTNVRQTTALAGWGVFNVSAVTGTVVASATVVEE